MMTAAKDRKFKAIVVYRLDRISRNISDFSSLIEELGRLGIKTKTGRWTDARKTVILKNYYFTASV